MKRNKVEIYNNNKVVVVDVIAKLLWILDKIFDFWISWPIIPILFVILKLLLYTTLRLVFEFKTIKSLLNWCSNLSSSANFRR